MWFGKRPTRCTLFMSNVGELTLYLLSFFSEACAIRRCCCQQYISWKAIGQIVSIPNIEKISRITVLVLCDFECAYFFSTRIVATVTLLAEHLGCYKMSLECKDSLVKFYTSIG